MLLVPYRVDVPMQRWPLANVALLGTTVLVFAAQAGLSEADLDDFVLGGTGGIGGWLTHMWLHAGVMHLAGNMVFLWVFGNAVCAKVGNFLYAPIYVGCGLAAAAAHMAFDGGPAIGASGAINGIVGIYLVFYPRNDVSCFYVWYFRPGTFSVSGFWMVLLWLAFDVLGVALGLPGVAYWAHLGGFAVGFGLGLLLVGAGTVRMEAYEESLPAAVRAWLGRRKPGPQVAARVPRALRSVHRPKSGPATLPFDTEVPRALRVRCVCGARLKAPTELAGRGARCPRCRRYVRVPGEAVERV